MEKGVKKIGYVRGPVYESKSLRGKLWVIPADKFVFFRVIDWYPGTTDADKKKDVTWIRQTSDRKTIKNQMLLAHDKYYGVQFQKKLCGNFSYYIEASLSGNRDRRDVGLFVKGSCEKRIISSKWSKTSVGENIKNKVRQVKYGDIVHLNLQTEGLNNYDLIIEVYNRVGLKRDDTKIAVITGVKVVDGEVDLQIGNTFAWMAKIKNINYIEDFYIKVKDPDTKQYVVDNLNQDLHAVCLHITKEVATTTIAPTRNNKVAKVGQAQSNPIKYEQCKFNKIEITEMVTEDGHTKPETMVLFNEGTTKPVPQTVSVIAPNKARAKELILAIGAFKTEKCESKKHTAKEVTFREVEQQVTKDNKLITVKGQSTVKQKAYSDLSRFNAAPIEYIWPEAIKPNEFWYYINSCRYFSEPTRPTVIVKVYPDIEWTLELSYNFTNPAAYTHANLPEYSQSNPKSKEVRDIIRDERKAQSKAVSAGIESKRIKNSPEMLTHFGLKLQAEWNDKQGKFEVGTEFAKKVRTVLSVFITYKEIADKVKNVLGGAVKKSPLSPPFMFEVQSPSLNAAISWSLKKGEDKYVGKIATVGKINFKGDPLIGASFTIDLLAVGSRMHPAVAAMIKGSELALSQLHGGMLFEAKFYGKLDFDFKALEINSLSGIKSGSLDLGAQMGVEIRFEIFFAVKYKKWVFEVEVSLRAKAAAKAHFAAKMSLNSDEKGLYYKPELGFSGLIFTFEAEVVVGTYKRTLKLSNEDEPFLKADVPNLTKQYILQ